MVMVTSISAEEGEQMEETRKRLDYVDAAKGLSIIMIMMGHITSYSNPLDNWMSSFKVSVFYIISGFLMCYTGSVKKRSFSVFTGKILRSLAVPYAVFSVLASIYNAAVIFLKHRPLSDAGYVFLESLCDSVFMKGIHSMWFLPTIFFGEIIFFWLVRSPYVIRILYAVAGLFMITAFKKLGLICGQLSPLLLHAALPRLSNALGKSLMAAWFLGAGYIIYLMYRKINSEKIKLIGGTVLTVLNIVISRYNEHIDINLMKEGTYPWLFYVTGIIGSVGAIMLLDFISQHIKLTFLNYWGRNSLVVMCTHTALGFKNIALKGWKSVCYIPSTGSFEYICECFVVLGILMLMMYTVIFIINTYFPFLIGKTVDHND